MVGALTDTDTHARSFLGYMGTLDYKKKELDLST